MATLFALQQRCLQLQHHMRSIIQCFLSTHSCGMVYVDSRNLGYEPYVWRWLNSRPTAQEADALRQLFDK